MKADHLLEIRNLRTCFHTNFGVVKAVDGINMNIDERDAVGLTGESGCGKTMTALSIMRLVPSSGVVSGSIVFRKKNLLEITDSEMRAIRGRQISMIFQDPFTFLNPVISVGDQIAEAILSHRKMDKANVQSMVIEILKSVGMPSPTSVMKSYPHQLSGGMSQRAVIAMMISCNPSLLIADEPTTALDVTVQAQILELLKDLREKMGCSLLLITHDFGILAEVCTKVYVMYAGKIVEGGDILDIYERPLHPYTKGLLASVLSIDQSNKILRGIDGAVPSLINLPSGCRFHPRCTHRKPICEKEEPPRTDISQSHSVYCWLHARS